jgi:hypothetical protein
MKEVELPTNRKLAKATAIAVLVSLALLVTVVLPAEYGFDPLRTGAALGLTQLSASAPLPEEAATLQPNEAPTPTMEGPIAHYPTEYKFDSVEFEIGPYEYVEYKYRLEKEASMLYSWTASSEVIHDFHGERDGTPSNAAESFEKRNRREASGMFTAPFSGIHGWYWENPGGEPVRVKLTTAGFYSAGLEIRLDHTRHRHEVTPLERVMIRTEANVSP